MNLTQYQHPYVFQTWLHEVIVQHVLYDVWKSSRPHYPAPHGHLLSVCISNTTVCHAILQFWYWLRVGLIKVVIGEKVSQHEAMQRWVMAEVVVVRFQLHQPNKLKGQSRHSISFLWLSLHSRVSLKLCSQHTLLQSISGYSFISRRLINNCILTKPIKQQGVF